MTSVDKGFNDPSVLLKHELAYCLGQLKNTAALSTLESVLRNKSEDPMVRHEVRTLFGNRLNAIKYNDLGS